MSWWDYYYRHSSKISNANSIQREIICSISFHYSINVIIVSIDHCIYLIDISSIVFDWEVLIRMDNCSPQLILCHYDSADWGNFLFGSLQFAILNILHVIGNPIIIPLSIATMDQDRWRQIGFYLFISIIYLILHFYFKCDDWNYINCELISWSSLLCYLHYWPSFSIYWKWDCDY